MAQQSEIAQLKQRIAELERQQEITRATNGTTGQQGAWYGFNEFCFTFRLGRTKLNTLIKRGLVEVDTRGSFIAKNGQRRGNFLYRWVA